MVNFDIRHTVTELCPVIKSSLLQTIFRSSYFPPDENSAEVREHRTGGISLEGEN